MSTPLVSVIIPTYNRKDFLREAIESVMGQTFPNNEIIVVDDGSTDGTASSLEDLKSELLYHCQPNRGVSAARNRGVALACGKYIAFLDSDDRWEKGKLQAQIECMETQPRFRVCHTDEIWIRDGMRINPGKRHRKSAGDLFERSLPLCIISPSSILMERSLFDELGGFDKALPVCEDYDLWLRLTLRHRVGFLEKSLVIKRGGHPDQLSRRFWGMDRFRIRALAGLILRDEVSGRRRDAVLEELRRKCGIVAKGAGQRGRKEEADAYHSLPERLVRHVTAFENRSFRLPDEGVPQIGEMSGGSGVARVSIQEG